MIAIITSTGQQERFCRVPTWKRKYFIQNICHLISVYYKLSSELISNSHLMRAFKV